MLQQPYDQNKDNMVKNLRLEIDRDVEKLFQAQPIINAFVEKLVTLWYNTNPHQTLIWHTTQSSQPSLA